MKKHTANIVLNSERQKVFPIRSDKQCSRYISSKLVVVIRAIRQKEEAKVTRIENKKQKNVLVGGTML
jgi:hypothetical protein